MLVSGEGTHTLTYYSEDAVGNVEQAHTATFGIDTTPPVTTDDAPSGWLTGSVTLTPTDSGSGMVGGQAGTWYSIDGGPYTAGSSVLFTDGTHTLTYYSRDAAGNVEQPHSTTVGVDTTPPVTTDNAPSGWQNGAVTVTLTPTDSGSGTSGGQAGTWYSIDGGPYTPGTSVQVTADGAHTLTYYSKDAAGNAETPHSVTVMTTLPTVAFTSPLGGESWPAGTSQTVSWTLSGALSVGQFRISFVDAANVQTTLATFSATLGQTSYSQRLTLPAAPAAGSTCRIVVYWRSDPTVDTWQLTAQSNAFTVSYAYSGISEVGHATATGSGTAVSITPAVSTQAGDVVLAVIHANASGNTITDNNGTNAFTSDIQENTADSSRYAIVHRLATASEPTTYRWTLSSSQSWSVQVRVFRGVAASVWDVAPSAATRATGTSGTTVTAPSMTTTTPGALGILLCLTDSSAGQTYSSPTNGYASQVTPGTTQMQSSWVRSWSTAGATGTSAAKLSASNDWVAHQFALKPAVATAP